MARSEGWGRCIRNVGATSSNRLTSIRVPRAGVVVEERLEIRSEGSP